MNSSVNPGQFLIVIREHKGIIYKVANSYCKNEENRKDLIQEIVLQLWLSFSRYDQHYKLSTWIYRIALNISISFYRKENRRTGITHPLPEIIGCLTEDDVAEKMDSDVEALHRFIKELKEMDRAVILLYLEKKTQQEIAGILGLTVTGVATKVSRIKKELKQKFSTIQK